MLLLPPKNYKSTLKIFQLLAKLLTLNLGYVTYILRLLLLPNKM